MSHKAQRQFIRSVRRKNLRHFFNVRVYDIGSMDINGNNRGYFLFSAYTGIDIGRGPNVDYEGHAADLMPWLRKAHQWQPIHTMISTEALEHDARWAETLQVMYDNLIPGGLMVITCAGEGRAEHGTHDHHAWCSPATNDYYGNVTNEMFSSILKPGMFESYHLRQRKTDLQFWGIKK